VKINDLPVNMRLEGSERREEIDRLQYTGFALRVCAYKQNNPPWNFYIQAGEAAKVGER
jgi:hypothetical protein